MAERAGTPRGERMAEGVSVTHRAASQNHAKNTALRATAAGRVARPVSHTENAAAVPSTGDVARGEPYPVTDGQQLLHLALAELRDLPNEAQRDVVIKSLAACILAWSERAHMAPGTYRRAWMDTKDQACRDLIDQAIGMAFTIAVTMRSPCLGDWPDPLDDDQAVQR